MIEYRKVKYTFTLILFFLSLLIFSQNEAILENDPYIDQLQKFDSERKPMAMYMTIGLPLFKVNSIFTSEPNIS